MWLAVYFLQAKFVKSGAMCIARIVVEKPICIEAFDSVPQVGALRMLDSISQTVGR